MTWKCFELCFTMHSPMHIGYRKIGYIQKSRLYVPGTALWGAVTAHITRTYLDNAAAGQYIKIGEWVRSHMVFGYFFLLEGEERDILPRYETEKGLCYNENSYTRIENQYMFTTAQTSIRSNTNTAEDESLHEMEFISHTSRKNPWRRNRLKGHLFFMDDTGDKGKPPDGIDIKPQKESVKKALKELCIGGERAYGSGRVSLDTCEQTDSVFGWAFNGKGEKPQLCWPDNKPVEKSGAEDKKNAFAPAHIKCSDNDRFFGDVELFAYRQWSSKNKNGGYGAGRKISDKNFCWVPGTRIENAGPGLKFEAEDYGIWKKSSR